MAAGNGYSFTAELDAGNSVASFIARAAFTRTGKFEEALTDWQGNTVEAALKEGGEG
jgi:hypothetical protein